MDMHFETIANDQTRNADLRIPTVNTHCITTEETKPSRKPRIHAKHSIFDQAPKKVNIFDQTPKKKHLKTSKKSMRGDVPGL
jgi:hypothetical protein